jgi:hypothetical protein
MPGWAWLAVVACVVVVVAVVAAAMALRRRRQRTQRLRERFGPEYDRTLKTAGGRRRGEAELERRLERRERLQVGGVDHSDRGAYEAEWKTIENGFEEAPLPAVVRAEALVTAILADRGYSLESGFAERTGDLSVDHPEAVEHYRRAHATLRRSDDGGVTHEDLYEALQHYRAFLDDVAIDGAAD